MTEIVDLSAERGYRTSDNRLISPAAALREAIRDIESGDRTATSLMILTLDRGEDGESYATGWYASNIDSIQMIALMEVVKAKLLRDMDCT